MRYTFQKWRETLPNVLTSSQAIYVAKIDSATGLVTSQSMTQKCLPNVSSSFVIIFVWTGSSLVHWWSCTHWCCGDITHWCCRDIFTPKRHKHNTLRCNMIQNWYQCRSKIYTRISFRIMVTNMLLASWNVCNIRMWPRKQFFRYLKDSNIPMRFIEVI